MAGLVMFCVCSIMDGWAYATYFVKPIACAAGARGQVGGSARDAKVPRGAALTGYALRAAVCLEVGDGFIGVAERGWHAQAGRRAA
jgi:hypothetical protein